MRIIECYTNYWELQEFLGVMRIIKHNSEFLELESVLKHFVNDRELFELSTVDMKAILFKSITVNMKKSQQLLTNNAMDIQTACCAQA